MGAANRAHAQSVRRMYEDGLSTEAIARRSGQSQKVVRAYLRFAYAEPLESRLLWGKAWRSQAQAARIHLTRYWREKYRAARTADAKADVQYEQKELELHG